MATLTITRRSRMGFSWTHSPESWTDHRGQSHLRISKPNHTPQETGCVRAVYDEYLRIAQLNKANYWAWQWFLLQDGKWVAVSFDVHELWMLLNSDPRSKRCPTTNSIEALIIPFNCNIEWYPANI